MPNVFLQGSPDPATALNKTPDNLFLGSVVRTIMGFGSIPTSTVIGDFIFLGQIHSSAVILPISRFDHTAATGATTLDLGFLNEVPAGAINCLAAAQSVVAAGSKAGMASVTVPNLGRRVWQHAGLTADPNRWLQLGHRVQGGNVTAAFSLFTEVHYVLSNQ